MSSIVPPQPIAMAADLSVSEALLSNGETSNSASSSLIAVKWALKTLMWALFIFWIALLVLYPTDFAVSLLEAWMELAGGTIFGNAGSIFTVFSAPILIIAFLAFFYVSLFSGDRLVFEKMKNRKRKIPSFRLWTFPVLTDGPFGVVSAAELIGMLLFAGFVLWSLIAYIISIRAMVVSEGLSGHETLEEMGLRFGTTGIFCLSFLFLPVARGSILLRLIDIPFEHAAKYHVWLGHLTMSLFTIHGLLYVIAWTMEGNLIEKITEFSTEGISIFPGVISLSAGLLMWVTSLKPVRNSYFEIFFYTHQLYIIFIVFLALHVGDFLFCFAAGSIFLFIMDRFLRFCQSRSTVDIISAAYHPCGAVELILSKPPNLQYNALSFIFLRVRECSRLQWHPFSVSSSPLDGRHHLSVLIKVLGEWTEKLKDMTSIVLEKTHNSQIKPLNLTASLEGPYGHESPYHLMYENLILVAGGIGISPFVAILSDILHRVREGKPCSARNILVVWAVKRSDELCLLSTINAHPTSHSDSDKINLEIQVYVTQELRTSLDEEKLDGSICGCPFPTPNQNSISCLVGTGNNVWSGIYVIVCTLGLIAFYSLVQVCYFIPLNITTWWYKGLSLIVSMVASVVICGGIVMLFWRSWERRCSNNENKMFHENRSSVPGSGPVIHNVGPSWVNLSSLQTVQYGSRPDFEAIFSSFGEHVGHVDVGVIVCGPPGFQSCVAKACRSQNIRGKWNRPVFHFNSHSFDL